MFRQLDFRSFYNFLTRNKLYTAINIVGLSLSLMFVILIADFTLRQLTTDNFHTKADRIFVVGSERSLSNGYYLQKHLLDRYPEIEATCAVSPSGQSTSSSMQVEAGQRKFAAQMLYADTTFFRMFDFALTRGDREHALAARENVVLSESFARKAFGTDDVVGQAIRIPDLDKSYVVSGVMRDIDRSAFPQSDIVMRAETICEINGANNEHMGNAGGAVTFVLVREGADLEAKIGDMLEYFRSFYWIYQGNVLHEVTLTPLREVFFSERNDINGFHRGSWSFVMILFAVGAVILLFAVINYVNLTVAQTGFRAKEMAARRLLGASKGEVILKLILESTLMCLAAFVAAWLLAVAVEPYASRLLEERIDLVNDLTLVKGLCYAGFVLLLGFIAGIVPALMIARYKAVDIVRGSFRRRTKMLYSRVLITVQNLITIGLVAVSIGIALQIRHLIEAPLGYNTEDILDVSTEIFTEVAQVTAFREELLREPVVEAVAFACGTPHDRGNNHTMGRGSEGMISFQLFIGDSVYYRMLGLERLRDNRLAAAQQENAVYLNQYAFKELGIEEDATYFKVGPNYESTFVVAGTYRDFQIGSALDPPTSAMLLETDQIQFPWDVLIKTHGDKAAAYDTVRRVFERVTDSNVFTAEYIEQQIEADFAAQRRTLRIVGIFTLVAILISALGLVAMSTYYIQQKQQEIAVRKVFGSTGGEVLARLTGSFMRLVGIAFVVAVPVAWYVLSRWLEGYSVRIALTPWIFLAAGVFTAAVAFVAVFWQSSRAAHADPVDSIKS